MHAILWNENFNAGVFDLTIEDISMRPFPDLGSNPEWPKLFDRLNFQDIGFSGKADFR